MMVVTAIPIQYCCLLPSGLVVNVSFVDQSVAVPITVESGFTLQCTCVSPAGIEIFIAGQAN